MHFIWFYTAWKLSVFEVSLVRISPHSDLIRSLYPVQIRGNTDRKTPKTDTFHAVLSRHIIPANTNPYMHNDEKLTNTTISMFGHALPICALPIEQLNKLHSNHNVFVFVFQFRTGSHRESRNQIWTNNFLGSFKNYVTRNFCTLTFCNSCFIFC